MMMMMMMMMMSPTFGTERVCVRVRACAKVRLLRVPLLCDQPGGACAGVPRGAAGARAHAPTPQPGARGHGRGDPRRGHRLPRRHPAGRRCPRGRAAVGSGRWDAVLVFWTPSEEAHDARRNSGGGRSQARAAGRERGGGQGTGLHGERHGAVPRRGRVRARNVGRCGTARAHRGQQRHRSGERVSARVSICSRLRVSAPACVPLLCA